MGLWDTLFGSKKAEGDRNPRKATSAAAAPPLQPIGHEDGKCPYCSTAPTKLPRQKRPCEHCGRIIYPRKRPFDGKVVFFREDELEQLEEQRAIAYGRSEESGSVRRRRTPDSGTPHLAG